MPVGPEGMNQSTMEVLGQYDFCGFSRFRDEQRRVVSEVKSRRLPSFGS